MKEKFDIKAIVSLLLGLASMVIFALTKTLGVVEASSITGLVNVVTGAFAFILGFFAFFSHVKIARLTAYLGVVVGLSAIFLNIII